MGWDETLFGAVWHLAGRAWARFGATRPDPSEEGRAVGLAEVRDRLRLVGSMLAGVAVEVVEAEREGGVRGRLLLLPARMAFAPTPIDNARAWLVRVAWSAASLRLGRVLPEGTSSSAAPLATLLAAPAIAASLEEQVPGWRSSFEALSPHLLARRPAPRTLGSDAARVLELATRAWLGESAAALHELAPAALVERALELLAEAPADAPALRAALDRWEPTHAVPCAPVVLWGELMAAPAAGAAAAAAAVGDAAEAASSSGASERRAPPRQALRRVELSEEALEDNPIVHSFEKVHTAEEYKGGQKSVDGADEMAEHGAALDELDLRDVVRSRQRAASLYRMDALALEGGGGDLPEGAGEASGIPYDEWDEARRAYRTGWCRVVVEHPPLRQEDDGPERISADRLRLRRHTDRLRAELGRLQLSRRWQDRQPDGPEVDVDAVVDRHGTLRSGHAPPGKLYRARRRPTRDLSVLILLDASLSTDAWVHNHRVLDVARESMLVLGDALDAVSVETGLVAFHSNTRRDCRYQVLKAFHDPWPEALRRLYAVEPTGYTRIGPALRHSTKVLSRCSSRRRLLLLISDGKPSDYDRYEGRYGLGDVRQAVREAEQRGITPFALAIDREARHYLPRMFGRGGFEILPRPEALPDALMRVYGGLLR